MPTVSLLLAGLAGLLHVGFFLLESVFYRRPAVHRSFGVRSEAEVEATAFGMLNQGFYNLFLGVGTLVGVVGTVLDWEPQGPTLVVYGCLFMIGAALVLVIARPAMARAAAIQGLLPALALVSAWALSGLLSVG
jgi:putative membrane protein